MQSDAASHNPEGGSVAPPWQHGGFPLPDEATNPDHAALLKQAQAEADAIRGELPLIQVTLNYELSLAKEKSAEAERALAEAHEEAQSLVKDAAEQASLIADTAERSAERLVSDARVEATDLVAVARRSAEDLTAQANRVMAREQAQAAHLREQVAAELDAQRTDHARQLGDRRADHERDLAGQAGAAEHRLAELLSAAESHANDARQAATREIEAGRAEAERLRADARAQMSQLLEESRTEAARELAAASEQMAWTEKVIAGLHEAADLDAQRIRQRAHEEAAEVIVGVRQRLAKVLATSRQTLHGRRAETEAEHVKAQALLEQAQERADDVGARATEEARKAVAAAEETARLRIERADRRLAEAEAGARSVREHVAEELAKTQRELHDLRRNAKAESVGAVEQARAEADELRSLARQLLADARAEVATLSERRAAITNELGNLSGIIEALAVPDGQAKPRIRTGTIVPTLPEAPAPVPSRPAPTPREQPTHGTAPVDLIKIVTPAAPATEPDASAEPNSPPGDADPVSDAVPAEPIEAVDPVVPAEPADDAADAAPFEDAAHAVPVEDALPVEAVEPIGDAADSAPFEGAAHAVPVADAVPIEPADDAAHVADAAPFEDAARVEPVEDAVPVADSVPIEPADGALITAASAAPSAPAGHDVESATAADEIATSSPVDTSWTPITYGVLDGVAPVDHRTESSFAPSLPAGDAPAAAHDTATPVEPNGRPRPFAPVVRTEDVDAFFPVDTPERAEKRNARSDAGPITPIDRLAPPLPPWATTQPAPVSHTVEYPAQVRHDDGVPDEEDDGPISIFNEMMRAE